MSQKLNDLMAEYQNTFDDMPPIVTLSDGEAVKLIEKALKEGKPVTEDDLGYPEGAIV